MRLGIGGGDALLDGNTPESGGGGDGTTHDSDRTPKRAMKANNTNDDSAPTVVITPGRAVDGDVAVFGILQRLQSCLDSAIIMETMCMGG